MLATRIESSRGRWAFFLVVASVFTLFSVPLGAGEMVGEVRGLLYLDGTPVSIEIVDGRIARVDRVESLTSTDSGLYVAPGLIDNQVNGYMSVSFTSPSLDVDGVKKATEALWRAGVTTYLPTLTTNSREIYLRSLGVLSEAAKHPDIGQSIPGFHLEGPYISPVDGFRGAHNKRWVRKPDWSEFEAWNGAAENKILHVSLAPEIDGAIEFIRKLVRSGIRVGLAHHNGSAEIIRAAVDQGAGISTHLGNGCANMIHRHDNPLWPQLADDRLMASIIVDGFHLNRAQVEVFFKVKGPERLILVSDAVALAGMPPGEYAKDGQSVVLAPEGVIRLPAQNVLAGAASPLDRGVERVMSFTGCSLADAIHMAGRNIARFYGWQDRGEIAVGKRADLILFSLDNGKLTIRKTILGGKVVYSKASD